MYNAIGLIYANYRTPELGALTENRTIAALPFGGRYSMIDIQLSNMAHAGITTLGMIMPYRYRSMISHISAGKDWSLDRKNGGLFLLPGSPYGVSAVESHFLLRDIAHNSTFLEKTKEDYVVIAAAGTVFRIDLEKVVAAHCASKSDVTVVTHTATTEDAASVRVVERDGFIREFVRGVKPGDTAALDCIVIGRELMLSILRWYSSMYHMDLFDILQIESEKFRISRFDFEGWAATMSSTKQYYDYSMELLNPEVRRELFNVEDPVYTRVQDTVPARYMKGSKITNSIIPAGCKVGGEIDNSILFRCVTVEPGAVVKGSILMQDVVVEAGAVVENAIIDKNNVIKSGTVIKGTPENPFVLEKA